MRYLVTGGSGFIGWHLVGQLARAGHPVTACVRSGLELWPDADVAIERVDVTDPVSLARSLVDAAPDVVVHLAAQSLPTRSWAEPAPTMQTNIIGTLNLLEAVRAQGSTRPRVIIASSSAQYASSTDGRPIGEGSPVDPGSPYAVSKMAADACGRLYGRAFELDIIRFRPFFWIGPRKEGDVASDIARRVVAIERGAPAQLRVGRTDSVRDMIDVRDGIEALILLAERGRAGEAYNVCRGEGTSIGDLIGAFRAAARTGFEIVSDPNLLRPIDEVVRVGDPTRIKSLGWQPRTPIEASVQDILEYWRGQPPLETLC